MSIEAFTHSAHPVPGDYLPNWFLRGSTAARHAREQSRPTGVAEALADAAVRNRARAARRGVRLACHASGEILSAAAYGEFRDRLVGLLSRAIGAAQHGSIVACEISIGKDEARCHLRFAVEACAGASSHLGTDWIDEIWSWPAQHRANT